MSGPYANDILLGIDQIITNLTVDNTYQPQQAGIIRMSEIGQCARRLGYKLAGHPNHYRDGSGLTFGLGKYVELLILEGMKHAGFQVAREQAECVTTSPQMRGHIDAEALPPDLDEWVLVEVKSANAANFTALERNSVFAVYPEYIDQMTLYMLSRNLRMGLFVVANKNVPDIYTCWVPFDHARAVFLLEKATHIQETVARGALPAPEYPKTSKQCHWCPYKDRCDGKPVEKQRGSIRIV